MGKEHGRRVHVGHGYRLVLRDLGLDEVAVLRRAGLPVTLLEGEGSFIGLDELYALHEAADAEADDPLIALKAGTSISAELFDPGLFAAICSPDMNTAAVRLGLYKRLTGPFDLEVEVNTDHTCIRHVCRYRPDLPVHLGLTKIVFLVAFVRRATRHEVVPRRVTAKEVPPELDAYTDFFGRPLDQGAGYEVVFDARDARRPFLTHNARIWETVQPELRRRAAEAARNTSVRDRVEAALFELLPSGRSQLSDVARELAMGTRTVQRRLAEEGTTWLEVLNQTRERLARHYLRTSAMSPSEVGFLLGFDDPNSLFRAFQRWTGTTPDAWRAARDAMTTR